MYCTASIWVGALVPAPNIPYMIRMMMAAGMTMRAFTLNLSLIWQPCVWVATTVVSEIKDRLSPK